GGERAGRDQPRGREAVRRRHERPPGPGDRPEHEAGEHAAAAGRRAAAGAEGPGATRGEGVTVAVRAGSVSDGRRAGRRSRFRLGRITARRTRRGRSPGSAAPPGPPPAARWGEPPPTGSVRRWRARSRGGPASPRLPG